MNIIDALLSWEYIRWVNLVLAMVVVAMLTAGTVKRWHVMPARYRRMSPWIIATYVVIAYGSGEALATNVQPGYRILLLLCTLTGLIVAIAYRLDVDTLSE